MNHWKNTYVAAALCGLLVLGAVAAPAHWYLWRSKLDGKTFCHQISPGEGWERVDGPFRDLRCEKPA